MSLKNYIDANVITEEILESVETMEDLTVLSEELELIESELNELFGWAKKAAKKVYTAADKAEAVADKAKAKVKEFASDAAYVAKNISKDAKEGVTDTISGNRDAARAAKRAFDEKKAEVKDKLVAISTASLDNAKKLFGSLAGASEEVKATAKELEEVMAKLSAGKSVSGVDAIKILAAVLAGAEENGKLPTIKKYKKQLERLRTTPGISSFKFSVKANA